MKHLKLKLAIIALSTVIFSCSDDVETTNTKTYNGFFILNEGGFQQSNSSYSFLSNDFSQFEQDLFATVNPNQIMGDIAQSMLISGDKMYVVVNNSNKIVILNRYTSQQIGTITTGIVNPRYLVTYNNKLYVSCWGVANDATDDYIAVINNSDYSILPKISVVEGPEKLLINNNNLFVAHKGGFGFGNKVSVINVLNNTVTNTINTGDIPENLAIYNNQLYVFCSGRILYDNNWTVIGHTLGKIVNYNLTNFSEIQTLNFNNTEHPKNFSLVQNNLYYSLNNQIYKKNILDNTIPATSFINPQVTTLYGLNIIDDKIFVCDAKNFISAGSIKVFNQTGSLIIEKTTEIAPNGVYIN